MKITELLLAIKCLATDLHESGAVRPDHHTKFSALRTSIDQAVDAADQAEQSTAQPAPPGAPEFAALVDQVEQLRHSIEAVGVVVDHTGDQVEAIAAKMAAQLKAA